MAGAGNLFLLHIAPRLDPVLIPRSNGRISSTGVNRVGLLTTTGANSGMARTHPVVLIDDGDGLIAVGSYYGRPTHPAWTHNLVAHPECDVRFRGPLRRYRAELLEGAPRADAWRTALDFYAGYALYEERAAPRVIRLFRLRPVDD